MTQRYRRFWLGSAFWLIAASAVAGGPPEPPPVPLAPALEETAVPQVELRDPLHKMGRGLVNVLTCWLEIPKQIHSARVGHPVLGIGSGLWRGVELTVVRLGVGVYEAVTFPLPYPRGFASPYPQMELSDYSWE